MTTPDWVEREAKERQELLDAALDGVFAERSFPNLERLMSETPLLTVEEAASVMNILYAKACDQRRGAS